MRICEITVEIKNSSNEPKENQAAAKQTFGFQGSLTSKYPAKQDGEHEVRICELTVKIKNSSKSPKKSKRLRSIS